MLWETVRLAARAITRNKLRSFLTVLGVVIGVAAVIAMVTVGQGSSAQVSANVASLGTNVLVLRPGRQTMGPGPREPAPQFTLRDAEALEALTVAAAVAPTTTTTATVVFGSANHSTQVTGSTAGYLAAGNWPLTRGRSFTEAEERGGSPVCILGETVRKALFGATDPIGQTLRVKSVSCTVIGLLAPKGAGSFGQDQDDIVLMPIRTVQKRLEGSDDVERITVALRKSVTSDRGIREIENLMRERRRIAIGRDDNFSVTNMAEIASMLTSINSVLTGLLSSVAAVSLLVGGIGIMNIMLVSVTERTREIGIRLAVGATSAQVLTQFLVEAVVLSILGGVIGIGAGLALAFAASQFMAIPFAPQASVVALAFCFSALIGVIFGYFPARRAARLDPIDALRHQ
ncbi:multidrug ABC transporter substrate-binding protein [Gemmobacter aquarius]|uniref:Multidrug ABC transporter substrate-binding protein n=1 Tax=Paragemmobacter aquarius TaxID=2169400 RepID=A0A2S0UI26_9RHOB|nr:ABC transporter permease [Gemmobacter aquarius]AWB47487.1 multidrug ABC transporter substrate-binding protein [Gemmobacter aquarius]